MKWEQPLDVDERFEVLATVCPRCGQFIVPENTNWVYRARFYCSEGCCRKAAER